MRQSSFSASRGSITDRSERSSAHNIPSSSIGVRAPSQQSNSSASLPDRVSAQTSRSAAPGQSSSARPQSPQPAHSPSKGALSGAPSRSASTALRRPQSTRVGTQSLEGADANQRVKVTIRIRPSIRPDETPNVVEVLDEGRKIRVHRGLSSRSMINWSDFQFDFVLPTTAGQGDVYEIAARPVVEDVLRGYNGCVMAYGQTGAGKTYTVSSLDPDHVGVMPRAIAEIFMTATLDTEHVYTVYMSYVQIYMEEIQDLLRPECVALQMREDPSGGVYLENVQEVQIRSVEECLQLLQLGERNRVYALTSLNAHSSRSHAVVIFTVEKRQRHAPREDEKQGRRVTVGRLYMVDLAGSERLKKSKSEGLRASEAKAINLSLTTLGMCINARADPNSTHVPFRDSKLTRLLQESIGGNAKTSLIVCVPDVLEHLEETVSSMQFGSRAMQVRSHARVNEVFDTREITDDMLVQAQQQLVDDAWAKRELEAQSERSSLQAEIDRLRKELLVTREQKEEVEHRLEGALERCQQLAEQLGEEQRGRAEDREQFEGRLQAFDLERAGWEEMRQHHEEEEARLEGEVGRLEGEKAELQGVRQELEGLRDRLQEEKAEVEAQLAATQEAKAEVEGRLEAEERRAEGLTKEIEVKVVEVERLVESHRETVERHVQETTERSERIVVLEGDRADLLREIEQLKARIALLQRDIEELQQGQRERMLTRAQREARDRAARTIQTWWRRRRMSSLVTSLQLDSLRKLRLKEAQKDQLLYWAGTRLIAKSMGVMEQSAESICRYFLLPKKDWKAEQKLATKSYVADKRKLNGGY